MYSNLRYIRIALLALILSLSLSGCGFHRAPEPTGPTPVKAKKVVRTAYSQMGKKYRLGGASPSKGFDCSGLVYWAYGQNGLKVPRVTRDQAHAGRAVSRSQLRPGDIVVFRTGLRSLHTGIYAGDGSFIHSPRAGERVRMESINVNYWKKRLITARRIVR
ncbi:MAG: C40 family peptidase [Desulfovibrio sp.]|nr:C40 family peptidase [Desulfovibrio sp.]